MDAADVMKLNAVQISSKPIAERVAALADARAAKETARKDVNEYELTREQAEWADAQASEEARAAGKPEPKRSHVAEHDRKLDEARHRHRVETLAEQRAVNDLQAVLDEHGQAWVESIVADLANLDDAWVEQVNALANLNARRASASAVMATVCGPTNRLGAVPFAPREINGVDVVPIADEWGQRIKQTAHIAPEDVLAGLLKLGTVPEPEPAKPVVHAPPLRRSPLLDLPEVQQEIAERRGSGPTDAMVVVPDDEDRAELLASRG